MVLLGAQNIHVKYDGVPHRRAALRDQVAGSEPREPFLIALGERVRALRARRGMTRKALALATEVSERHLANLEYGVGNASILVLLQVTQALQCSFAELLGDPDDPVARMANAL